MPDDNFHFEISLSVLNHLGRKLYRNFITVLGEAISNSWDAEARNVWITINGENSSFVIKDDGNGMTVADFQSKFLKVGYSKRRDGIFTTGSGRPYIGAKGIGKLALLSCADKISVFSKTKDTEYIGGVINNSGLDEAIKDDILPSQYSLEGLDFTLVGDLMAGHEHGTIIHFANTKAHIQNSIAHLRKLIAMTFRFSVIDENFTIHVNGDPVTVGELKDLSRNTQFCWAINNYTDSYVEGFHGQAAEPIPRSQHSMSEVSLPRSSCRDISRSPAPTRGQLSTCLSMVAFVRRTSSGTFQPRGFRKAISMGNCTLTGWIRQDMIRSQAAARASLMMTRTSGRSWII